MDMSAIFKRAWEITWKHKGLWVLGILANCAGGGSQGSGNVGNTSGYQFDGGEFPRLERWFQSVPEETWITIGIAAVCLVLLLAIVFWVLAVIGNGGLISGFNMAETGEPVTLGSAFKMGMSYFGKLLIVQLLIGLASLVVILPLIVGGVLLSVFTLGLGLLCFVPLLCLLVPLGIALTIYTLFAQIALIVEGLDVVDAFKRAWEVFRAHLGEVVVMGLILGVGGFVAGLLLALPFILLALPLITGFIVGTETSGIAGVSVTVVGMLLYLPVYLTASGIMRTFITGSWTLTYRGLIETPSEATA